ncbi:septum formation initiator family protein [Tepidimonas charontis]|uniref:Cell division protein FtsB n=1 Tax=Tepidimonas charontis TaxID=2267262 RepID=A0A554XJX6_9BURK|nr:septum formation initiator family protein [Tepidimonas charontis]TSE36131.1 Cell division protein FtsB [Tepidimonas charontis]
MRARWVTAGLLALLGAVHAHIWWGRASVANVEALRRELLRQEQANEAARQRNERLTAEVHDLREGLQTVEEIARESLGMVKPNEIFVQIQGGAP